MNQTWNLSSWVSYRVSIVGILENIGLTVLTDWPLGCVAVVLEVSFSISLYKVVAWAPTVKILLRWMPPNLTNENSALVQVAVGQQAITWASIDPDLCHHMASLSHNEMIRVMTFDCTIFELLSVAELGRGGLWAIQLPHSSTGHWPHGYSHKLAGLKINCSSETFEKERVEFVSMEYGCMKCLVQLECY